MRWAPLVFDFLRALGGVAVLIGAGVFVYRAYLEEPALAITDFDELSAITITNRSTQPIYVLRARWDAVSDPSLSRQLRMPQEITIAETVAPDGGTIHRDLEPRVDYGAHNAHSVPLDENALREIAELKPYEIRYFMLDDRVREKPLPLGARMTIEFVWRGSSRTEVVPIGAFLYKLHSRAKPES